MNIIPFVFWAMFFPLVLQITGYIWKRTSGKMYNDNGTFSLVYFGTGLALFIYGLLMSA